MPVHHRLCHECHLPALPCTRATALHVMCLGVFGERPHSRDLHWDGWTAHRCNLRVILQHTKMPPTRVAERALRVATTSSRQYICKSCRAQAHAARQFSSSTRVAAAEEPFYRRLQRQIFGNKEQEADQKLREQKAIERQEEALGRGGGVDVDSEPRKVRKNGVDYEVAAYVDPQVNKDYVPASSADGLEIIGSDEWVRQREDHGEVYVGYDVSEYSRNGVTGLTLLLDSRRSGGSSSIGGNGNRCCTISPSKRWSCRRPSGRRDRSAILGLQTRMAGCTPGMRRSSLVRPARVSQ